MTTSETSMPLLEMRNITAGYGKSEVLHGVSLRVERGEIVTMVGANGAGKTTTLRSIFGFTTLSSGSIWYRGQEITNWRAHKIVGLGLAYVPQDNKVFPSLTVRENLEMGGFSLPASESKTNRERVLDLFPRLRERIGQKARTLSGGERQMLAVARGLMTNPEMLVLDEPSLGLAPQLVASVFEQIQNVHDMGVTVFVVEQNAQRALEIAHRAYILEFGQIRGEGSGQELLADDEVRKAYLGEG